MCLASTWHRGLLQMRTYRKRVENQVEMSRICLDSADRGQEQQDRGVFQYPHWACDGGQRPELVEPLLMAGALGLVRRMVMARICRQWQTVMVEVDSDAGLSRWLLLLTVELGRACWE